VHRLLDYVSFAYEGRPGGQRRRRCFYAVHRKLCCGAGCCSYIARVALPIPLAPFKVVTVVGDLRLRIDQIKDGGQSWYMAHADIPVQVVNSGARIGRILGYRLRVSYPSLPIEGAYETFSTVFVADQRALITGGLKAAIIDFWTPFSILPKAAVHQHIVFNQRWDDPVVAETIRFTLQQARDGQEGWVDVGSWESDIDIESFDAMVRGSTFSVSPEGIPGNVVEIQPADLYNHLKPARRLPDRNLNDKVSRCVKLTGNHRYRKKGGG
jgi:hypothetical protein